jgi:hypothetical protein
MAASTTSSSRVWLSLNAFNDLANVIQYVDENDLPEVLIQARAYDGFGRQSRYLPLHRSDVRGQVFKFSPVILRCGFRDFFWPQYERVDPATLGNASRLKRFYKRHHWCKICVDLDSTLLAACQVAERDPGIRPYPDVILMRTARHHLTSLSARRAVPPRHAIYFLPQEAKCGYVTPPSPAH